jgi:ferredoxin
LNKSFRPVAACTFIGEHSFSGPKTPIAAGRPDSEDLTKAEAFGKKISDKLTSLKGPETAHCPNVPGNIPYKEGAGSIPFTPQTIESACTQCSVCLSVCPTGAISLGTKIEIDCDTCIFCCACIKICPENALIIDAAPIKQTRQRLFENCAERKEPELYL